MLKSRGLKPRLMAFRNSGRAKNLGPAFDGLAWLGFGQPWGFRPSQHITTAVETRGRKNKLTAGNINVCLVTIEVFYYSNCDQVYYRKYSPVKQWNDLYPNELHEMAPNHTRVSVDDSTIWKVLYKKGFTMKKVRRTPLDLLLSVEAWTRDYSRSAKQLWSAMKTDRQHSALDLGENVIPATLFLLMRAPSIDGLQFATDHGHYMGIRLRGNVSLCKATGVSSHNWIAWYLLIFLRYSLLPALSLSGMVYAKIVEGLFMRHCFLVFLEGLLDQMDLEISGSS